jgi:hypothetical protein
VDAPACRADAFSLQKVTIKPITKDESMNWKMTRLSRLACAAVLGSAAVALPLHAEILDFEGLAPRAVGYTDVLEHKGYTLTGESGLDDALPGDLVGGVMNGSHPTDCVWLACPGNNPGSYYAGLNDGVMLLSRQDHQAFSLQSLDASFIGPFQGVGAPEVAGILRIQGFRADHSYTSFDIELPTIDNKFYFDSYSTAAFGSQQFVSLAFFAFSCDYSGDCTAFETNQGQFAIDNLNVSLAPVPEPASYAMFGAGLLAVGAISRRRKAGNHTGENA